MALDAATREDYETFHTLAWRVVQTGPRNDVSLMYLLARAQSLSGRAQDALVMLRRIADMGMGAVEAETSDDFRRVRSLPGWTDVLDRIHAAAGRPPASKAPVEPMAPSAPAAVKPTPTGNAGEEVAVPATLLRPVALDYDAVSRRFVFADESTETLKILDDLSGKAVNLVSRGWAGTYRTAALAIDRRRGDLWVAGSDDSSGEARSAVHRLQLVSGRLLYTIALPDEAGAARFTDVAILGSGALVLDQRGRRIYALTSEARTLRLHAKIDDTSEPASIAPAGDTVIYIAHGKGISRLDLAAHKTTSLSAARGINLQGMDWIREYNGSLIGIQKQTNGGHAAVRIRLNRRGNAATSLEIIDPTASRVASLSGDVLYYLAPSREGGHGVRRRRLR